MPTVRPTWIPYLLPAGVLLLSSCSHATIARSAGDILSSIIRSGGSVSASAPEPVAAGRVINTADDYLGTPYKWGGTSPKTGFDCSGYVRYVFAREGVQLPRTSREQAGAGAALAASVSQLRVGDIMLFAETKKPISHVAIYAGDGRIIHSSSSGGGVRFDDLGTQRGRWYVEHMVAARRLVTDGRSLVQALALLAQPGLPFDPPDRAPRP